MSKYYGDFALGASVRLRFNTSNTSGVPTSLVSGTVQITKDGANVTPSGGVTLNVDIGSVVGRNDVVITMVTDETTFSAGSEYSAWLSAGTVAGASVVGSYLGEWSVANRVVETVVGNVAGNVTGSVGSITGVTFPANFAVLAINATGGYTLNDPAQTAPASPTLGTFGAILAHLAAETMYAGVASAGTANSVTLGGSPATDLRYLGCLVRLTSGTGAPQARRVTAYDGVSKITPDINWVVTPDSTTHVEVVAEHAAGLDAHFAVNSNFVDQNGSPASATTFPTNFAALAIDASGHLTLAPAGLDLVIAEPAAGVAPAINARQAIALAMDSAAAGLVNNVQTTTPNLQNPGGTVTRVAWTMDASGNRTAVVLTLP